MGVARATAPALLVAAYAGDSPEVRLTPVTRDACLTSTAVYVRADGRTGLVRYVCLAETWVRDWRDGRVPSHVADPTDFLGVHREPSPDVEVLERNGFDLAHRTKEGDEERGSNRFFGFGA